MTPDLTTLADDELTARRQELYPSTQQPGCPREVTLEYFAMLDEYRRRHPIDLAEGNVCSLTWEREPEVWEFSP